MTTSQVFQIGAAVIAFLVAVLPQFGIDAKTVALVGGAFGTLWGTIGGILTKQSSLTKAVAAQIDDPAVKATIVPAVANLPGVERVRTNALADATLKAMADSNAPELSKIQPPK